MKRTKEVFKNDFIKVSEVYNNFRFTTPELEMIKKYSDNGDFLGDGVEYENIIQMKRDLNQLLELIDVELVFHELHERETYKVVQYESSLPFDGEFELYTGLNKRSAYNIARRLSDKMYKYECENECDTGIQYLVIYTNEYGESISVDYTVGM